MTQLTIKITKSVLEATKLCGRVTDKEETLGENCAIAYAVRELFPDAYVGCQTIYPEGAYTLGVRFFKSRGTGIGLPVEASLFIKEFDQLMPAARVKMTPFEFNIEVPDEIIESVVSLDDVKELLKNSETLVIS